MACCFSFSSGVMTGGKSGSHGKVSKLSGLGCGAVASTRMWVISLSIFSSFFAVSDSWDLRSKSCSKRASSAWSSFSSINFSFSSLASSTCSKMESASPSAGEWISSFSPTSALNSAGTHSLLRNHVGLKLQRRQSRQKDPQRRLL